MRRGVGKVPQVRELAMNFRRHGGHLVTQAQIQRQVRLPAPVILEIAAKEGLAKIAGREGTGDAAREFAGSICQKRLQIVEGPDSIRIAESRGLEQHALSSYAELDGMGASNPESVVIHLK